MKREMTDGELLAMTVFLGVLAMMALWAMVGLVMGVY